jgi:hypothetical protein
MIPSRVEAIDNREPICWKGACCKKKMQQQA